MPQNKNLAWENLIMAKATNGIGEFDQKLLDIMKGRMTDVSSGRNRIVRSNGQASGKQAGDDCRVCKSSPNGRKYSSGK